jgi:hypothetical protein
MTQKSSGLTASLTRNFSLRGTQVRYGEGYREGHGEGHARRKCLGTCGIASLLELIHFRRRRQEYSGRKGFRVPAVRCGAADLHGQTICTPRDHLRHLNGAQSVFRCGCAGPWKGQFVPCVFGPTFVCATFTLHAAPLNVFALCGLSSVQVEMVSDITMGPKKGLHLKLSTW